MPAPDPNTRAHLEWLGFIQPNGLVVSAPALVKAGAILNRQDAEGQGLLAGCVDQRAVVPGRDPEPCVRDFREFASAILGWGFSSKGYAGTEETPVQADLTVVLPDYGETLHPDFAVRERDPRNGASPWQLLVQVLDAGQDFDKATSGAGGLEAAPQGRAERLLRGTGVPAGVLFNGVALRLISAPRGESSGWMDFRFADLTNTAGRPLCSALRLLLSEQRLLALPRDQRLAALLESSRKYQNEVSERLSEQVLHALYELLRGFQAAHDASGREILREPLSEDGDRNDIYRGLLSVILRLVFLLYAEERGMLPEDENFARYYSLTGLYQRLREDAALNPDTMDQRFGAWAQLLVLFRLIHDGARAHRTGGAVSLPERRGALFDPDRFRFLEGRSGGGVRQTIERVLPPHISDGVVYRVLEKLLVLDGERISYRTLDVEQIGSVYEIIMGFRLETATGRSVAIKPAKKLGAPNTIDLDALLAQPNARRGRWLHERADRTITDKVAKGLREAETVDDLHAALDRMLDKDATSDIVPPGALVLQPNEERRRSGSHYTPRELTEPIVRHTLEPILDRLRGEDDDRAPTPEQILDLKICDPAMGSGAFLVETCRQLADALIDAWGAHGAMPTIPPDEDEVIYARRLVAQKCLYGIDRNPMAVDLAKVSLWLSTLARDHPLTFVDHAFRHGDSLVGLTRRQIEALHWKRGESPVLTGFGVQKALEEASALRRQIREADDVVTERRLQNLWRDAQDAIIDVRLFGDLVLAAFFEGSKPKERESRLRAYQEAIVNRESRRHAVELEERRNGDMPFAPFHWEIEFPEVFERENPGFDGFVGNPPFAGKNSVAAGNIAGYPSWLKEMHEESHGNADLVAHFYRRAFSLVRDGGTFGLIATNTIAQGDTRSTGLRWICEHGGEIYRATKRVKWPGDAAVIVSVLHVAREACTENRVLDGETVDRITAFLFHRGGHADPARLAANAGKSFIGSYVLGMGFTFDDTDRKGVALSLAEMERLIESDPRNRVVIFPYIGGEEVNTSPTHAHRRYVINFGDRTETECRKRWPLLMAIVDDRVKPARMKDNRHAYRNLWWQHAERRKELYSAIAGRDRVLVVSRIGNAFAFAFVPTGTICNEKTVVFPFTSFAGFAVLQSRAHEVWARFFSSTLKDDMQYTPSTCFESFPFPKDWDTESSLEAAGRSYYECRAALMIEQDSGMTKTYNRFHDIYETDSRIVELRRLHAATDRAVLDAYGWNNIPTDCDFLLDYDVDEATWGRKKKPYRYRWPDTVRDEVLARLVALNGERAAAEARAGVIRPVGRPLPKRLSDVGSTRLLETGGAESPSIYETGSV